MTKSAILDSAVADTAFSLPTGEVSQPVKGQFSVALVKVSAIQPGNRPTYENIAADLKKEIAAKRAVSEVASLRDKMEDERGGGASVADAAKKLSLTPVTLDAVDRSGRQPDGQPASNIPLGLDVVAQAFNSDVGVDNEPISYRGGYVWYEVLGITPPRDRSLDEVKDQVAARWRADEIATRLRAKATDLVQKLNQGGKLAEEAAPLGLTVETATSFRRDATLPGVPTGVITAAFRTAKDSGGQTEAAGGSQWIVFRVTDVTVPAMDMESEEAKKLKDTLQRALNEEQSAQYVTRLEKDIGTTINEAALAQVVGGNNQ